MAWTVKPEKSGKPGKKGEEPPARDETAGAGEREAAEGVAAVSPRRESVPPLPLDQVEEADGPGRIAAGASPREDGVRGEAEPPGTVQPPARPGILSRWVESWLGGRVDNDTAPHISILGSKQSGKTYLFQGLVHRLSLDRNSLAPYLGRDKTVDVDYVTPDGSTRHLEVNQYLEAYRAFKRIPQSDRFQRIKTTISYRRGDSEIERIELTCSDQPGEKFGEGDAGWEYIAASSGVIITFTMFALVPAHARQSYVDRQGNVAHVDHPGQFGTWVHRLLEERSKLGKSNPGAIPRRVEVVIALTMADDPRSFHVPGWDTWHDRWMRSYDERALAGVDAGYQMRVLNQLNRFFDELINDHDVLGHSVRNFAVHLGTRPRFVPVRAIEGWLLDYNDPPHQTGEHQETDDSLAAAGARASDHPDAAGDALEALAKERMQRGPRPIHVETPLLYVLSRYRNFAC